jgi:hypothetical protein
MKRSAACKAEEALDLSQERRISMRRLICTLVVLGVVMSSSSAFAAIVIGGTQYYPVSPVPNESVTAPFYGSWGADSTPTVRTYHDFVMLKVRGVGQSWAQNYNDAFYVYTGPGSPTPLNDADYHQLAVDTKPIYGFPGDPTPPEQLARSKIFYDLDSITEVTSRPYVPLYREDHVYSFVVDVGTAPSNLWFTVADGIY